MDGLLLFNKPILWTSHDAVDFVRRITGQRAVGHAGTLDPMATGLLLILLGQWTKKSEELMGLDKGYEGTILFGVETDSHDLDGKIVAQEDVVGLTPEKIAIVFESLTGTLSQVPPAFSAIKNKGKKSYQLARKGLDFERKPREIRVHDFRCVRFFEEEVYFSLSCTKGTYVRSLAFDFGRAMGIRSTLSSLVRTRIGDFPLERAVTENFLRTAGAAAIQSELIHESLSGTGR